MISVSAFGTMTHSLCVGHLVIKLYRTITPFAEHRPQRDVAQRPGGRTEVEGTSCTPRPALPPKNNNNNNNKKTHTHTKPTTTTTSHTSPHLQRRGRRFVCRAQPAACCCPRVGRSTGRSCTPSFDTTPPPTGCRRTAGCPGWGRPVLRAIAPSPRSGNLSKKKKKTISETRVIRWKRKRGRWKMM